MSRTLKLAVSSFLVLGIVAAACSQNDETSTPAAEPSPTETMESMDIVETAVAAGEFNTLVAAVEAADLVDTLKGEGPFTVFAPTDAAFAALPEGTLDSLLLQKNQDQLAGILTYHVVPGSIMASDVTAGAVPTVNGGEFEIATDGGVTITDAQGNTAQVVQTDIVTSNGVIHVIDTVLLP